MIVKDNLLRLRGLPRRYRGFGEDISVDEQGNIVVTGQTGQTTARTRAGGKAALIPGLIVDDQAALISQGGSARQEAANIKTVMLGPEEVYPDDPRHPQHAEWLADQVILSKRAASKARLPFVIAGGGGLAAAIIAVLVLKKRRKAATP